MIYKYLKHASVQTILIIGFYALYANSLADVAHRAFYTASILIKDVLIWTMPLTIFSFIAYTVSSFKSKAPMFIVILILFEAISNFLCVWYGIGSANMISNKLNAFELIRIDNEFSEIWKIPFIQPSWWSPDKGCAAGLILGCFVAYRHESTLFALISKLKIVMEFILTKIFTKLIPIFVLGFVAHMHKTGILDNMIAHYGMLILYLIGFLSLYITLIFLVASSFSPKLMIKQIKNLLPACSIALTCGCSLSTMPFTIKGTAKNLQNPEFAKAIIPATTNIQQVGDCITHAFLALLTYYHFNGSMPDMSVLVPFSFVFVMARFTTTAVLGGAFFIILPIYQAYFNYTDEMTAIIFALNVILDPIVTSSNVIANGGLAKIFEMIWNKVSNRTFILRRYL